MPSTISDELPLIADDPPVNFEVSRPTVDGSVEGVRGTRRLNRTNEQGYQSRTASRLGIAHITVGSVIVVLGIATVYFQCVLYFIALPLWTGSFFVSTGSVAIISSRKTQKYTITTYMVCSCVSILFALSLVVFGTHGICEEQAWHSDNKDELEFKAGRSIIYARLAIDGGIVAMAIAELILSMLSVSVSRRGLQILAFEQQRSHHPVYIVPVTAHKRPIRKAPRSAGNRRQDGAVYVPTKHTDEPTLPLATVVEEVDGQDT
ncbi:uncharacterized protein LOC102809527 [Saccoglossus kowalevskii]|uniref:Uncharacterized protein LOC102809527 n=1 Tax=Saccoglossus kowalevskii TaxID=10224 RepID=A0ABM0MEC6_SACKO|nr:PREDICTED: uncharacterized protein LOC102809527 [Saccoglossus kowalevskii]